MSVLLRQPHGFEGFGVVEEVHDLDDRAISDGVDGSQAGAQVDPAGPALASPVETSHDPVAPTGKTSIFAALPRPSQASSISAMKRPNSWRREILSSGTVDSSSVEES